MLKLDDEQLSYFSDNEKIDSRDKRIADLEKKVDYILSKIEAMPLESKPKKELTDEAKSIKTTA